MSDLRDLHNLVKQVAKQYRWAETAVETVGRALELEQGIKVNEKRLGVLQKQVETAQADTMAAEEAHSQRTARLEEDFTSARAKIMSQLNDARKQYRAEVESLKSERATVAELLARDRSAKQEEIAGLEKQVAGLQARKDRLEQDINAMKARVESA